MFGKSSPKSGGVSLVIDIQSGLVRAALACFSHSAPPHIIYLASKTIPHKGESDGAYLIEMMGKTVEEVLHLILEQGMPRLNELQPQLGSHASIQSIQYILSSPWIISQSKTVKISYEKDTEITEAIITSIVEDEKQTFLKKFKENNLGDEYEFDLAFIEQKIFDVRLNGYSVTDYRHKKVRSLEISFASTTSSKRILGKIQTIVENSIPKTSGKPEVYHSSLLLQYAALRSLIGNGDEYISLHVHGELSDIIVVKKGISSYIASFPFGVFSLLRAIAASMKTSEEAAASLVSLYLEAKLEQSEQENVSRLLEPLLKNWQGQCLASLALVGEKTHLPRLLYLSCHSHFELFKRALAGTQFEVVQFDGDAIEHAVTFEKSSETSKMMAMYVQALNTMVQ